MKEWYLRTLYNLSIEEYNMFKNQRGCCAIFEHIRVN